MTRMSSFVSGGIIIRNACGSTTLRIACPADMPSDRAASTWPLGTAWIPPRIVSAR